MRWPKPRVDVSDIPLAAALYTLNILDMVFTLEAIRIGYSEWNPIMRWLLEQGTDYFIFFKTFVILLGTLVLLAFPVRRNVNVILVVLATLYAVLSMYHLALFLL